VDTLELFSRDPEDGSAAAAPLADRMRPRELDEFLGQDHILGPDKVLRKAIEKDELHSAVFWGPPGSGKTTLARLMAIKSKARFVAFSAVTSGIKEIRQVIEGARKSLKVEGRRTILFIDELHRFNKAQQDAFLPHVEHGTILLLGATTENPSFEVNSALLSRCRVYVLERLSTDHILTIMERALADSERGLGHLKTSVDRKALVHIASYADGDARRALNALELAVETTPPDSSGERSVTIEIAEEALQKGSLLYDRDGEEHYNLISAFIKSIRGSDPDAALYWLARMLAGGEDPLFVARRLVILASEDVGNADPHALPLAVAAKDAVHFVGPPESDLVLAHATTYLASAPKSNASYAALLKAKQAVQDSGTEPVPLHLRNAPTRLMKNLGYGKDYQYPHEDPDGFVREEYLPAFLKGQRYYFPKEIGAEKEIRDRLGRWRRLAQAKGPKETRGSKKTEDVAPTGRAKISEESRVPDGVQDTPEPKQTGDAKKAKGKSKDA
jgi:putative ATPase